MAKKNLNSAALNEASGTLDVVTEGGRQEALVKAALATAAELAGIQGAVSDAAIVAVTDVTGKIEQANDNFVRISKYSREELIGQDHRLLNSGLHPKEFFRDLWATIAGGKVWRNEIHNRAKDGSLYWVDTTIAPILNERGKPIKYVAVRFDISARKQAEETLLKAGHLQSAIFNSANFSSIATDAKGVIQIFNVGAERMLGYVAADVVNKITPALARGRRTVRGSRPPSARSCSRSGVGGAGRWRRTRGRLR